MIANLLQPGVATYIFIIVTLLWWVEFIIFRNQSAETEEKDTQGRRSFYLILAATVFPLVISLTLYFLDIGNLSSSAALVFRNAGVAIYVMGISIRYWSLIMLGRHFSRNIEVQEQQPLVSNGPYRLIRHPAYTGLLLLNTGLHFFIGNLPGIIIAIISISTALHIRIIEEERSMAQVLGERYRNWNSRRKRLFPWIY